MGGSWGFSGTWESHQGSGEPVIGQHVVPAVPQQKYSRCGAGHQVALGL